MSQPVNQQFPQPPSPQPSVQPQASVQSQPVQPVQPAQPVQPVQPAQQPASAPGSPAQPQVVPQIPAGYGYQQPFPLYQTQPVCANAAAHEGTDKTLRLVAFVFCLLSTIAMSWLILPLAWKIPMTVHCWGLYKGTKANTVAFGVCTLIFCSLVGGILLLASKKDPQYYV